MSAAYFAFVFGEKAVDSVVFVAGVCSTGTVVGVGSGANGVDAV